MKEFGKISKKSTDLADSIETFLFWLSTSTVLKDFRLWVTVSFVC